MTDKKIENVKPNSKFWKTQSDENYAFSVYNMLFGFFLMMVNIYMEI